MYEGFLRLGGTEIANANRVEAYVANHLPGFPLRGCQSAPGLPRALGQEYNGPLQDGAPWIDPSNPATHDFYGFYPILIQGVDDSTVTATVTESLSDGGFVNSPRASSREIRVRGVLIGANRLAVNAGMTWLNEAVAQVNCEGGTGCNGARMEYFTAPPEFAVCYQEGVGGGSLDRITGLRPGQTIQLGINTVNQDLRVSGTINPVAGWRGLTFTWGVSRYVGSVENYMADPVVMHGPVTPYRANLVRNPRFVNDTATWTGLTRVASGGPTGDAYGSMTLAAGVNTASTLLSIGQSLPNMLQFWARTTEPTFEVNLVSTVTSAVIQSETFTGDTDWNFYTMPMPSGAQVRLDFVANAASAGGTFDVSHVLQEAGTQVLPYFDGDLLPVMPNPNLPDATTPHYAVRWGTSGPHNSASVMEWVGGAIDFEFCGQGLYAWMNVLGGNGTVDLNYGFVYPKSDEDQVREYARYMRDVSRMSGPRVVNEFETSQGVGRTVEFVLVAATPFAYTDAWPYEWNLDFQAPIPFTDAEPPPPENIVVVDPDCPPIPAPPRPPIIDNACVVTPGTWDRYTLQIPAEDISRWSPMLPTFRLKSADELRQLRVRSYRNPLGVRYSRTNKAKRPYPVAGDINGGGWALNAPSIHDQVNTTTGVRRVGSVAARQTRKPVFLDFSLASFTRIGSYGSGATPLVAAENIDASDAMNRRMTFSVYYRVIGAPNPRYQMRVQWYNAAGTYLIQQVQPMQITLGDSSEWHRAVFTTDYAPLTASFATVAIDFLTSAGGMAEGGEMVYIQDFQAEYGPDVTPYFDGDGYKPLTSGQDAGDGNLSSSWLGAVNASESVSRIDPFGFESEFIVSYLPEGAELTVDSTVRRSSIRVQGAAAPVSAANLLYGLDGGPMTWPEYRCGTPYIITVDVPPGTDPNIDLNLELTRRE